jgi:thiol-disulfide isomerase/thioredoxin
LSNYTVEKDVSLNVSKDLPASKADLATKVIDAIKVLTEGISGCNIEITSKVGAGDPYSTITDIMPIKGEEKVSLEHKEGEVWLVDFWATWCPPCQRPMAHNQEMLEKRGADWGGKVRIIGISIDQTKEVVVSHCEEKKWMSIEHYHRHESKCSNTYGVKGVPHVMLVDTKGNIAFMGHPANRPDLEKDFDALLKGETLIGQGCGAAPKAPEGESKADEMPEGYKEFDMATVGAEINDLHAVFEGFIKDEEMKTSTKELSRAFCVLVLEMKYSPKTEKFIGKYDNHRVLQGLKEHCDKVTAAFDEKVKGTFGIISRVKTTDKKNTCD